MQAGASGRRARRRPARASAGRTRLARFRRSRTSCPRSSPAAGTRAASRGAPWTKTAIVAFDLFFFGRLLKATLSQVLCQSFTHFPKHLLNILIFNSVWIPYVEPSPGGARPPTTPSAAAEAARPATGIRPLARRSGRRLENAKIENKKIAASSAY